MKHLSKSQETARAILIQDLRECEAAVRSALASVNVAIVEQLNVAIQNYNAAVAAVSEFQDEIVGAIEGFYETHGNTLPEQMAANYESWRGDWACLSVDELDEEPELGSYDMSTADELDNLPSAPEGDW